MSSVPWKQEINFSSALLLHSCLTILLKELFNSFIILIRTSARQNGAIRTSVVLDGYTSILSNDIDGELAELYFTNTGLILLAVSLSSSVAMNLLLSSLFLNVMVASTFGLTFVASLLACTWGVTLPVMALRRAGRFIWSDTPFVNFFSVIYIATVLQGSSTLRLQDYVTFRCIAIVELMFMKAKLAASDRDKQVALLKSLVRSEWVLVNSNVEIRRINRPAAILDRNSIVTFTTTQRMAVMLFKTSIGYHHGSVRGSLGPAAVYVPPIGQCVDQTSLHKWRIYRMSEDVIILEDRFNESKPEGTRMKFLAGAHGILLRQIGKVRVVYLLKETIEGSSNRESSAVWRSNTNLVTGVSKDWLEGDSFTHLSVMQEVQTVA